MSPVFPPIRRPRQPRFFASDVVLVGLGVSSAIVTAIVVALLALSLGFAIHLYFVWIIPAGAYLCGMASAAGYPLGAIVIGRRPGRLALFGIATGGLLTYLLIFVFEYLLMEVNGRSVSADVSFGTFVDAAIRETTLNVSPLRSPARTGGPRLGPGGYPFAVLSLLGFIIGSCAILATPPLRRIACDRCPRYVREIARTSGYVAAPLLESTFIYARDLLAKGETTAALQLVGALSQTDLDYRIELDVWSCDACTRDYYDLRVLQWDTMAKPPWVPIKKLNITSRVPRLEPSVQVLSQRGAG